VYVYVYGGDSLDRIVFNDMYVSYEGGLMSVDEG